MFAALIPLVQWVLTKGVGTITAQLDAQRARKERAVAAQNTKEIKLAEFEITRLENIQKYDKGNPIIRQFIQILASVPAIAMIWKLFIYDRMLGLGVTDPLSAFDQGYVGGVLSFWLLMTVKK